MRSFDMRSLLPVSHPELNVIIKCFTNQVSAFWQLNVIKRLLHFFKELNITVIGLRYGNGAIFIY